LELPERMLAGTLRLRGRHAVRAIATIGKAGRFVKHWHEGMQPYFFDAAKSMKKKVMDCF